MDIGGSGEGAPFALQLMSEVVRGSREAATASLSSLNVREKVALLAQVADAQRALQAAHLSVVRALGSESLAEVGATSVAALVSSRLLVPRGRARADVAAASATDPESGDLRGLGAALTHGETTMAHVDVAVATLDKVPNRVRRECAPVIDEFLTRQSRTYRPKECANLARAILDRIDPDRAERGFDPEAFSRRSFSLTSDLYGMGLPAGQLDPMTTVTLKTALDHFSAPTPAQSGADGAVEFRDERTPGQRRCDALAEIARRALASAGAGSEGTVRSGERPRIVLHASPDQIRSPRGSVECESSGPLPAAFLRRVLCDCVLERVLLAPSGAILDLGRAVRTASPAQRRALAARDGGCVWPGCTVPPRWTEVHHVPGYVHGSNTDVAEMCLLCGAHHQQVEAGYYTVVMVDGVPHIIPPAWVDAARRPVRNTYWRDKAAAAAIGDQLRIVFGIEAEEPDGYAGRPPPAD